MVNIHPWLMRHGVCLADLGHDQREAALALMRETMSEAGYPTARDVMRLNEHALRSPASPRNTANGSIGSASSARHRREPWGWQLDGHHLNVNCFVLGDQLVLTPVSWAPSRCSRASASMRYPRLRRGRGTGLRADAFAFRR